MASIPAASLYKMIDDLKFMENEGRTNGLIM